MQIAAGIANWADARDAGLRVQTVITRSKVYDIVIVINHSLHIGDFFCSQGLLVERLA